MNFQFGIQENGGEMDMTLTEGNFVNTGNSYEIFVYHKPPSARSELLIGYSLIANSNK